MRNAPRTKLVLDDPIRQRQDEVWVVEFSDAHEARQRWGELGSNGLHRFASTLAKALEDLRIEVETDRHSGATQYSYRVRNILTGRIVMVPA